MGRRLGCWDVSEGLSYLGIAEANATQITGHLQTKGPQLFKALQCGLLHLLHRVILGRIIHLLRQSQDTSYLACH